jgi:membrane protease YdiL (CAAX protease family)
VAVEDPSGATLGPEGGTPGPGTQRDGVFTLEGRRAPGLYLASWLLSVGGLVLFLLVGPMASEERARYLLIGLGCLSVAVGLAAGAGSQIVERRDRHPDRYHGPAPLLLFFAYFFALTLVGLLFLSGGIADREDPVVFLVVGALQGIGYAVLVWLAVVRSGALTWGQMGWPAWQGGGRAVLRGIATAVVVIVPTTAILLVAGGLIGSALGVEAPDVLPSPEGPLGAMATAIAAALVIPVGEELFFRGFALTAWLRDLGPRRALVRSAAFFALVHIANITASSLGEGLAQVVLQTAVILPLGFVLGWLFLRHGMAGAIGGHVTYNSILLCLVALASNLPRPT